MNEHVLNTKPERVVPYDQIERPCPKCGTNNKLGVNCSNCGHYDIRSVNVKMTMRLEDPPETLRRLQIEDPPEKMKRPNGEKSPA